MLDKLTEVAIKNAKAKGKPYKLADGGGMYLLVTKEGQKWWRFDYRIDGKRKTISLGVYDDVALKTARELRRAARAQVAVGTDPSNSRKAEKITREGAHTFRTVADEWLGKHQAVWAAATTKKTKAVLGNDLIPWLGPLPLNAISSSDVLKVLRRIEERGAHETAHKARQYCQQIFRYGIATGRTDYDPTHGVRGALAPVPVKHHAAILEPKAIGKLLRAMDGYNGQFVTRCALSLAPIVFVRPGELRRAEWAEIDLDAGEWRISADKMKMKRPHIVPLSTQAIEILRELQPLTGKGRYVFPGIRSRDRPMSENTINAALRGIGYSGDQMVGHGFRSIASTRLNEMGWNRDAIERQLAHVEGNQVRAAYNYAEHLSERRRMMQAWADYLDSLKRDAHVVQIQFASGQAA